MAALEKYLLFLDDDMQGRKKRHYIWVFNGQLTSDLDIFLCFFVTIFSRHSKVFKIDWPKPYLPPGIKKIIDLNFREILRPCCLWCGFSIHKLSTFDPRLGSSGAPICGTGCRIYKASHFSLCWVLFPHES